MAKIFNKHQKDAFKKICSLLSEHFEHFGVVVLDEEEVLEYDYSQYYIGKMLFKEASNEMSKDDIELVIEMEEDEE
tara:strand:+ start:3428 stop:3655 length:228 start_codon:yes stop_codon:yes gene_type:complete